MKLFRLFGLFSECFSIAGTTGLIACVKYLFGVLRLPELDVKSSDFSECDFYV